MLGQAHCSLTWCPRGGKLWQERGGKDRKWIKTESQTLISWPIQITLKTESSFVTGMCGHLQSLTQVYLQFIFSALSWLPYIFAGNSEYSTSTDETLHWLHYYTSQQAKQPICLPWYVRTIHEFVFWEDNTFQVAQLTED